MKYYPYFVLLILLAACTDVKEKPPAGAIDSVTQKTTTYTPDSLRFPSKSSTPSDIVLQTLDSIPPEISGCSGLFKVTDCSADCGYVFASNLQGKAFIQIGKRLISLTRTSRSVTEEKMKERYEGEGYTISIEAYPTEKTGDELWVYNGELKVVRGNKKVSERIRGEIGC